MGMENDKPPSLKDSEEVSTSARASSDTEGSLIIDPDPCQAISVEAFLEHSSTVSSIGKQSSPRRTRQQCLKTMPEGRMHAFGAVDQMYNDALEDLEVSSGAFFAANVAGTCNIGKKEDEGLSRPSFAILLGQLDGEHGRALTQLAELKFENASLRRRLATLGQSGLKQPVLSPQTRCYSDGALVASPKHQRFPKRGLGSLNAGGKDLQLLGNCPNPPTSLPALLKSDHADEDTKKPSDNLFPQPCKLDALPSGYSPRFPADISMVSQPTATTLGSMKSSDEERVSAFTMHVRWSAPEGIQRNKSLGFSSESTWGFVSDGQMKPTLSSETRASDGSVSYTSCLRRFIRYPTSPKQLTWDLLGAVLILYDLLAIPLRVFDPPETTFTEVVDQFALIFWTLNMFASLTTSYLDDGKYVLNPLLIFKQYMRFWFWIDLVVVAPDWIFTLVQILMNTQSSAGSLVKLTRILRLLRCIRLLRLAKLQWIIASIKDLINSESVDIVFNIAKMILCLLALNHFLACLWFATSLIDAGDSWVKVHGFENDHWTYQYATSFHWAITQFTPSSMEIQPQNIYERTFCVCVVVAGLIGFSYLAGSITGSLAELRRMKEDAVRQFWNLRRFLRKSQVPRALRIRIEKYLLHAWQHQKESVTNGNLPILKLLTEQLGNELNCAMSMPHLEVHGLFEFLRWTSGAAMQRIATKALSRRLLARGESNFHPGEIAQHMSFVVAGKLQYSKLDHHEWVTKGEDWITEPAMWIPEWMTLGELVAVSVSELLEVSPTEFAESIKRTPQVYERVCIYASNFVQYLNGQDQANLSDICQGDIMGQDLELMLIDKEAEYGVIHSRGLPPRRRSWGERALSTVQRKTRTFVRPFLES